MEFTRKNYLELYRDGQPVIAEGRSSNRHVSLVEAGEHAEQHAREIGSVGDYEVRIDGGLYYMVRITELTLDASLDPEVPPQPQATFSLDNTSYSGDENTNIQFSINRAVRVDQVLTVDWAVVNATVTPLSGTETFNINDTQKTVTVLAGEVDTNELGNVIISNAQYVSGPIAAPVIGSPSSATFQVIDLDPGNPVIDFPRTAAGRIGDQSYSDIRIPLIQVELDQMVQTNFSVVNTFSGLAGRLECVEDLIAYAEINAPWHTVFVYSDLPESSDSASPPAAGSAQEFLEDAIGPGGTDGYVYDETHTTRQGDFGNLKWTNITLAMTPSAGRRYSEWYADEEVQPKMDFYNTPGNPARAGAYNDVSDHKPRGNNTDYNGNSVQDDARSDWNTAGTEGWIVGDAYREGHRRFTQRIRDNNSTVGNFEVIGNLVTHWNEWSGTVASMFRAVDNDNDPTVTGIWTQYEDGVWDGAWMEGQAGTWDDTEANPSSFPFCGITQDKVDGGLVVQPFGSWRLAMNGYLYLMHECGGRKLVLDHWGMWVSGNFTDAVNPVVGSNTGSANMTLGRWGLGSTLMDNGFHCNDNRRSVHNVTVALDEWGTINQGTTGLFRGWLGQPIDAGLLSRELAKGNHDPWSGTLYARRFDNGAVFVNSSSSSSATITVKVGASWAAGEIESGMYKLIDGHQDPTINDGSTLTSDYVIGPHDARILRNVA